MSVKTASQINIDIATYLPDNTSELIDPQDIRDRLIDIKDSYVNTTDFFTGTSSQYVAGDGSIQPFTNFISDTAYDATSWNGVTTIAPSKNAVRDEIEAIYTAIASIDLTPLWNKTGNTLSAKGVFGSTSGAYGWDYKVNNVVKGGVENTGEWYFGDTMMAANTFFTIRGDGNNHILRVRKSGSATIGGVRDTGEWYFGTNDMFTNTDFSVKGSGNTSATYGLQVQNSDNSQRAWFRNDGLFTATGGLSTDGTLSVSIDTTNDRHYIGQEAGSGASGTDNFFGGFQSGYQQTGSNNNLFSTYSGYQNSGSNCFFAGRNSGQSNASDYVIGIGSSAGKSNTGGDNQFYGRSAGENNNATPVFGFGFSAAYANTGSNVFAFGTNAAKSNTRSSLFTVSNITDIFWNNVGDQGSTTLQTVTMQSAMSQDGTDTSAAASILKIAQARGVGAGAAGTFVIQKANVQASGTTRHTLTDWWYFEGSNFGMGGNSYGSGVGVVHLADALTDSSANPTGGFVLQSKSGRAMVYETDGSLSYLVKAVASTKTTAGAPYTNDGYIEVVINGTTVKLMTTA